MTVLKLKSLTRNCTACPSQWEGETEDGNPVYICFRWGCLRVEIDDEPVYEEDISDGFDGYLTNAELVERVGGILGFPAGMEIGGHDGFAPEQSGP